MRNLWSNLCDFAKYLTFAKINVGKNGNQIRGVIRSEVVQNGHGLMPICQILQ